VKRGKIDARNKASAVRNPSAAGTITPTPPDGLRAIQAIDFLHRIARFTHPTKNERRTTDDERRTPNNERRMGEARQIRCKKYAICRA
jgi:hypothetical protein